MNKEIKENLTGLMVTLGTDTERKFAWCLRKVNNRPFIYIKDMKNIINKIKEYIYIYIKYVPYNNNIKYYKDSANCSIFYISINKIITKWLINNICYYLHINKNKNIHLRIYK